MKENIVSFFLVIIILIIIVFTVLFSLDMCGIISLPEKLSLKTYLSDTIEVVGFGKKEEIYYPDYDATGIQDLENIEDNQSVPAESDENNTKYTVNLGEIVNGENNNRNTEDNNSYTQNITDNSFYYNQLDTYGKTIYSRLYSNLDNLKSGKYVVDFGVTFNELLQTSNGETTLTNSFQLAINALLLDHPEIFYLDVTKMYMFTESTTTLKGTTYKISIGPDSGVSYLAEGFYSERDVLVAEDEIDTILYTLKSNLYGNVYEQILQVHDFLVDTVEYNSDSISGISHSIYGALVTKVAVCDGYSKAFKFILDNIGISCVEVCGIAQNSAGDIENHAWNDVLINGKWYAVDVTWDDPIIIGGNGKLTRELKYNYFLKGSEIFFQSHEEDGYIVENGLFKYPILSSVDYRN